MDIHKMKGVVIYLKSCKFFIFDGCIVDNKTDFFEGYRLSNRLFALSDYMDHRINGTEENCRTVEYRFRFQTIGLLILGTNKKYRCLACKFIKWLS